VAFASLFFEPYRFSRLAPAKIKSFLYNLESPVWLKKILDQIKRPNMFRRGLKPMNRAAYYVILIVLLFIIGYTAYYSGVGQGPVKEQAISLITMGAIILFFMIKKFEIKALYLFGIYSFEIYLFHWPLLSRYDLFFKWLPGWLALILYLGLFLILAWALNQALGQIRRVKGRPMID
jgi:membrane-bound acyltransferase YfiQ involved in biofilm formation